MTRIERGGAAWLTRTARFGRAVKITAAHRGGSPRRSESGPCVDHIDDAHRQARYGTEFATRLYAERRFFRGLIKPYCRQISAGMISKRNRHRKFTRNQATTPADHAPTWQIVGADRRDGLGRLMCVPTQPVVGHVNGFLHVTARL